MTSFMNVAFSELNLSVEREGLVFGSTRPICCVLYKDNVKKSQKQEQQLHSLRHSCTNKKFVLEAIQPRQLQGKSPSTVSLYNDTLSKETVVFQFKERKTWFHQHFTGIHKRGVSQQESKFNIRIMYFLLLPETLMTEVLQQGIQYE